MSDGHVVVMSSTSSTSGSLASSDGSGFCIGSLSSGTHILRRTHLGAAVDGTNLTVEGAPPFALKYTDTVGDHRVPLNQRNGSNSLDHVSFEVTILPRQ